ncbi:MAG TPA: hypothetical protein P5107_03965 [Thermotogota bacterium]|nr:hypothetical protein [Thermotogota bacterium]HRW34195.1 hypothetical protein [Thermotogota bacterium]
MNEDLKKLETRLERIEQKTDILQKFINNEYNDLTEEIQKLNKNYFAIEIMFYIIIALVVVLIVLLVI